MAITMNRYGQADIDPGAGRAEIHDALDEAINFAVVREPGAKPEIVLWDQIEMSTEILRDEERTLMGTALISERNLLTVRVPVVIEVS